MIVTKYSMKTLYCYLKIVLVHAKLIIIIFNFAEIVHNNNKTIKYYASCFNDNHRENCAGLNSGEEFFETRAWLYLTFFLCLHNKIICFSFYCHILKSTDV